MSENVDYRNRKVDIHKGTVETRQNAVLTLRGIITQVDLDNRIVTVAVPGGDPFSNPSSVKAYNTAPGLEGEVNLEDIGLVGSGYTFYKVPLPNSSVSGFGGTTNNPVPGVHVVLNFSRGQFNPFIQSYELVVDTNKSSQHPIVIVDTDKNSFTFVEGGKDSGWTTVHGPAGYRFAPITQNPTGANITVTSNFNLNSLLDTKNPNPEIIRKAMEVSTPSGFGSWVDVDGVGHHAVFGDVSHNMAKQHNLFALGSNAPIGKYLKNPMMDLMEAFGIDPMSKPPMVLNTKNPQFKLSPAVTSLANTELGNWTYGYGGFLSLTELTESFLKMPGTSGAQAKSLLSASTAGDNAGLDYSIGAAVALGVISSGTVLSKSYTEYFENYSTVAALPFDISSNNTNFLSALTGSGAAWAALIAAIRSSLKLVPESGMLTQYLNSQTLIVNSQTGGLVIPNLFGFCSNDVGDYGLKGNRGYLSKLVMPDDYSFDPGSKTDKYTYGDLVTYNLLEVLSESESWSGSLDNVQDLFIPNVIALPGLDSTIFSDRLYMSKGIPSNLNTTKAWIAGLYTAQVRTLVQEILFLTSEYIQDSQGLSDTDILLPTTSVTLQDDRGQKHTVSSRAWSSGFIAYLMIRLFTGEAGKNLAVKVIKDYSNNPSKISHANISSLMGVYKPQNNTVWWDSIVSRFKFVVDFLARSKNLRRV
jgi:hypothetical protein